MSWGYSTDLWLFLQLVLTGREPTPPQQWLYFSKTVWHWQGLESFSPFLPYGQEASSWDARNLPHFFEGSHLFPNRSHVLARLQILFHPQCSTSMKESHQSLFIIIIYMKSEVSLHRNLHWIYGCSGSRMGWPLFHRFRKAALAGTWGDT